MKELNVSTRDIIGTSIPHPDGPRHVTGQTFYSADIHMPNMLYCKIKMSDRAHAKITRLDVSKAEALPGVAAVVTAKDLKNNAFGVTFKDEPHFATDKVRQFCDYIAAVAAETLEIAEQAVALIEVDYEDLPVLTDPEEAMKPDACIIHKGDTNIAFHRHISNGDVEEGFAQSDYIIEQSLSTPSVEHAFLEPHAAIAHVDPSGDLVIYSSMQRLFEIPEITARAVGWPVSKVRGIVPALGGAFGGKNDTTIEPAVAALTLKTGRPVKCEYTREDEFNASTVRHAYRIQYKTGITKEGKIMARQVRIVSDNGAYTTWGVGTISKACIFSCGPYDIPNMKVDGYLVYTNNPVGGAMRGFGVTQLGFAYEAHTNYCAEQIGMDPIEFRRINFMKDHSKLPTAMSIPIVTVEECLDKAINLAKEGGDWA